MFVAERLYYINHAKALEKLDLRLLIRRHDSHNL